MNVYYFHHQADELLGTASEQFLGKSVKEIKQTVLQTLEGHLRAILGKSQPGIRARIQIPVNLINISIEFTLWFNVYFHRKLVKMTSDTMPNFILNTYIGIV